MAKIVTEEYYDGAKEKIERLGLWPLINEIKAAMTSFKLEIKKQIHINGAATLRELIDGAFGMWATGRIRHQGM